MFPGTRTPIDANNDAADAECEDRMRAGGTLIHEGCCYASTGLGNSEEGADL